ncbi:MAG: crossover junction endodeoxyribonuclease RuvC [Ignavibacteriales bacterium]|nr:crossover junction endodeoxyribonuclease RuvC [Ignavibacteriales bacterium]
MKRTTSTKPRILACDPSLTAWGWAVLEEHLVVATGVITTKPNAKKRRIREGDDRVRRTQELLRELDSIIRRYQVTYIVAELPHGSQNARAAIMMGIVTGALEGFNVLRNIPLEWYSENDAKKALLGHISASKKEVIDSIDSLYEVPWTDVKYVDEAVADALAIYYCAECNSPTIKFMTQ